MISCTIAHRIAFWVYVYLRIFTIEMKATIRTKQSVITDITFYIRLIQTNPVYPARTYIRATNILLCFSADWHQLNTLWTTQNDSHNADSIFKFIFLYENCCIFIGISLKFVAKSPINNKPELVQLMALCQTDNKPFPEQLVVFY